MRGRGRPTYLLALKLSLKSRETRRLVSVSSMRARATSTRPSRARVSPRIMTVGHLFTSSIGASATCPWPVMIHWPDRAANAAPTCQRYRFPRRTDVTRERISRRLDITTRANRGRRTMHPAIALRSLPAGFLLCDNCGRRERCRPALNRTSLCKFWPFLGAKFVDILFKNFNKILEYLLIIFSFESWTLKI